MWSKDAGSLIESPLVPELVRIRKQSSAIAPEISYENRPFGTSTGNEHSSSSFATSLTRLLMLDVLRFEL
jgi:hypothetical protein